MQSVYRVYPVVHSIQGVLHCRLYTDMEYNVVTVQCTIRYRTVKVVQGVLYNASVHGTGNKICAGCEHSTVVCRVLIENFPPNAYNEAESTYSF